MKLKDVCEKASSNIAQKDILENDGEYPIYGASGFIKTVDFYVQEEEYIGIVKDGAGVGRVMVLPAKSSVTGTIQYIIPNEKVLVRYLANILTKLDLGKLYSGATIPHIYFKNYENIKIPLPPIEEQKRIADILDKASNLIDLRKQQLEKMDLLIKSKFIDMFGDPVTNPKGWEVKNLGELSEICRGGSPRPIDKYIGGTIPWIKIGDATKGNDLYLFETAEHIIEEGVKKSRLVKQGSLIFANCGVSLGFARIIQFDGCIHDGWLAFENIDRSIDKLFLLKSINNCTEHFRKIAPEGTQPNLNTSIMKLHKQIVPPISLQTQFTSFVEQVEKQKAVMQQSLEKMETNYKALMQEYFG